MQALALVLLGALAVAAAAAEPAPDAYDSLIKPLVKSVYWHVTGQGGQCTAVHSLNSTTGQMVWRRSPVEPEQRWSTQLTDKRAFFTLEGSPVVTALSIEGGNLRWTWPQSVGRFWKRLDTDLPQHSPLVAPLPALATELLLLRAQGNDSKVLALTMADGTLAWEFDAMGAIGDSAAKAGLGAPQDLAIGGWLLEGPTTLFLHATAMHNVSPPASAAGARGEGLPRGGRALRQDQVDVSVRGWVLALDVARGAALWCSGPLEQGVHSTALSEPVLLVTSERDASGGAWLYGLDKGSGALLYSLPNAGQDVQVVDTRVALLTGGLRQRPVPALDSLAAFELATGKVLWEGLVGSLLLPLVVGDCTAIAAPRMHMYFACTCNITTRAAAAMAARPREASHHATRPTDLGGASTGGGGAGASGGEAAGGKPVRHPPPSHPPPPRPAPVPEIGLCAFAMTSDTGRLGSETLLSTQDAVPELAYEYGLQPLIMADLVVFPGRQGVYATARLAANFTHSVTPAGARGDEGRDSGGDTSSGAHGEKHGGSGGDTAVEEDGDAGARGGGWEAGSGGTGGERAAGRQRSEDDGGGAAVAGGSLEREAVQVERGEAGRQRRWQQGGEAGPGGHGSDGAGPEATLGAREVRGQRASGAVHSLRSPLHSAGAGAAGRLPLDAAEALPAAGAAFAMAELAEAYAAAGSAAEQQDVDEGGLPSTLRRRYGTMHSKVEFTFKLPQEVQMRAWDWLELRTGQLLLRASPAAGATPDPPSSSSSSSDAVRSGGGGGGGWEARKRKRKRKDGDEAPPPSSYIFSLNSYSGDLLWSLRTNLSGGTLTPHAMPRDWGRGSLLLVDGCRPPVGEEDDSGVLPPGEQRRRRRQLAADGPGGALPWWRRVGGRAAVQPEDLGDGTSCCLLAVVADSGKLAWRHCFDLDQACASGIARHTATTIVYVLLALQVVVLAVGCVVGIVVRHRLSKSRRAALMDDPDSEFEYIEVPAPGAPVAVAHPIHGVDEEEDEDEEEGSDGNPPAWR